MRKIIVTAEMADGTVHGPERVIFADKMRTEKSCRAGGWAIGQDEFRTQSLMTWAALHRTGAVTEGYEQWLDQVIDIDFDVSGDTTDDPTKAGTSA